jgi:phytoene desaturase
MKLVVIGSGFGGLSAAIRLRHQGHDVTIVDKLDKPGGRAYVFEQDGFKFDAGPTIITAPWLIHDLFEMCGKVTDDYVKIVPVTPFYNIRFEDGSVFRYTGDRSQVLDEVRRFNPADVDGYERFYRDSEDIFQTGFGLIDKPFHQVGSMLKVLPELVRLRSDKSVAKFVSEYVQDERLRQVFSFHPLLVGGNPFQTTSIYTLIHRLEQRWGVWFAMGGTGALVKGLTKLFTDIGGTLRLSSEVQTLVMDPATRKATGVQLASGEVIHADAVVCNGDVAQSYVSLVPKAYRRKWTDAKVAKQRYSMSLFVMYFGTNKQYTDIAHHEILMGPRYKGLLDDIFENKTLSDDFSLYLHRPTATDPSLAPPGHDCWYVLSPVPHLGGDTDWAAKQKPYRDAIVQYLEQRYMPGLSQHIVTERVVDPRYFRDTLNSFLGSAFSVEPRLSQSAWMRPHNRSEDVPNLFFCGAGTHPGAGLPGVISSGKIVADLIGPAAGVAFTPSRSVMPPETATTSGRRVKARV